MVPQYVNISKIKQGLKNLWETKRIFESLPWGWRESAPRGTNGVGHSILKLQESPLPSLDKDLLKIYRDFNVFSMIGRLRFVNLREREEGEARGGLWVAHQTCYRSGDVEIWVFKSHNFLKLQNSHLKFKDNEWEPQNMSKWQENSWEL